VSGTDLKCGLEAHRVLRYCLNCRIDHSLSHHAVQRFLPDQAGLRPPPAIPQESIIRPLTRRPRYHPSDGRPPCASSPPRRCAPSCSPAPLSPAVPDAAPTRRGSTRQRRCSIALMWTALDTSTGSSTSRPKGGSERSSASHSKAKLLVRRHAASARRFVGALLAPTPSAGHGAQGGATAPRDSAAGAQPRTGPPA